MCRRCQDLPPPARGGRHRRLDHRARQPPARREGDGRPQTLSAGAECRPPRPSWRFGPFVSGRWFERVGSAGPGRPARALSSGGTMTMPTRPTGITILAVLSAIGGVLALLAALFPTVLGGAGGPATGTPTAGGTAR